MALGEILEIQNEVNIEAENLGRPCIDLLSSEEVSRTNRLIDENTWPQRWTGGEPSADVMLNKHRSDGTIQPSFDWGETNKRSDQEWNIA